MIAATIAKLEDKCLVTFCVYTERANYAPYEFYANKLSNSPNEAVRWAKNQHKVWLKKELLKFLKMREQALIKVGAFTKEYQQIIDTCKKSNSKTTLIDLCRFILDNQLFLRALVPNRASAQFYLHYLVEEIISSAHKHLSNTPIVQFN
jgi:hypothetical protein